MSDTRYYKSIKTHNCLRNVPESALNNKTNLIGVVVDDAVDFVSASNSSSTEVDADGFLVHTTTAAATITTTTEDDAEEKEAREETTMELFPKESFPEDDDDRFFDNNNKSDFV